MPMAFHKLGKGTLQLRGMFSAEPFTFPPGGSPLLFQTGETYKGQPLIDRQHPHDLFMELSAQYTLPLGAMGGYMACRSNGCFELIQVAELTNAARMRGQTMSERMKILIGYDGSECADAALQDLRRGGLPAEADVVKELQIIEKTLACFMHLGR